MNERRLVEAFRAFFQKSVEPHVSNNEAVMNDWRSFSNMICCDPLNSSQLQFYTMMANKSNMAFPKKSSEILKKPESTINTSAHGSSLPKKNLVSYLESFQNVLVRNQERLEQLNKKDNTPTNGITKRYY